MNLSSTAILSKAYHSPFGKACIPARVANGLSYCRTWRIMPRRGQKSTSTSEGAASDECEWPAQVQKSTSNYREETVYKNESSRNISPRKSFIKSLHWSFCSNWWLSCFVSHLHQKLSLCSQPTALTNFHSIPGLIHFHRALKYLVIPV